MIAQNLFATSVQERYRDVLDRVARSLQGGQEGPQQPRYRPAAGGPQRLRRYRLHRARPRPVRRRAGQRAAAARGHARCRLDQCIGRDRCPPTGLGWFVQKYNGETVVWQFGQTPNGYSSLILKIPAKRLTLILLANSDGLSSSFDLPSGDVTKSLFAVLFLRLFG